MDGVAGCHGAHVHGSVPGTTLPLLGSLAQGSQGRAASTWRTQAGDEKTARGGVDRGRRSEGEGVGGLVAPSDRGQVTVGQWLLSPRPPQLRQQEPPGINMQITYKIRKHHRALGPSCLVLGIRVHAQSIRDRTGKASPWPAESSLDGLSSPDYRTRPETDYRV